MTAVFLTMEKKPISFADCWSLYFFLQYISNTTFIFIIFAGTLIALYLFRNILGGPYNHEGCWPQYWNPHAFFPSHKLSFLPLRQYYPFIFNSTSISNIYAKPRAPDWLIWNPQLSPFYHFFPTLQYAVRNCPISISFNLESWRVATTIILHNILKAMQQRMQH